MAVTTESSTQLGNIEAPPQVKLEPLDLSGKLRVAHFNFTQGAAAGDANSVQRLVKLPAGKVRVFLALSRIAHSAFGAARVLDLGWEAYKTPAEVAVVADPDGLDVDTDVSAAGSYNPVGTVGGAEVKDFESANGVVLSTLVTGGTIPAAATLNGYIVYAVE